MALVTAQWIYSGMSDYWGGNGDRWDDNKGCLFAYYGDGTTVRDLVDSAVDDYGNGGDCDSFPDGVTDKMIRDAILGSFSDAGRADYRSGAVLDIAVDYAEANGLNVCRACGEAVGSPHDADCSYVAEMLEEWGLDEDEEPDVEEEDCKEDDDDDYCGESPFVIFLVECEVCSECGELAEHEVDSICAACYEKAEEPQPEDFTVSPCGSLGGKSALGRVEGKFVGEFDCDDDAVDAARAIMEDEQFWPDIWIYDDHGGCIMVVNSGQCGNRLG